LKQQEYRTAIVTNNVREFGDTWRAMVALDDLFDIVVDSCEVGVRKPNPAIYHLTLAKLGDIEPERAVFLDDAPGNVDGALKAGLAAILVSDPGDAVQQLEDLLANGNGKGG
jgi:putative hydrolase of the HAD superfamily